MDKETAKQLLKAQKLKEKNKTYYENHREELIAKKREQYNAEARKAYYEANKEKLKLNKAQRQQEEIVKQTRERLNNLKKIAQPQAQVILDRMLERIDTKEGLSRDAILGIEMLILTAASINDKPLPVPPSQVKPEQWVLDARDSVSTQAPKEAEKE